MSQLVARPLCVQDEVSSAVFSSEHLNCGNVHTELNEPNTQVVTKAAPCVLNT